MDTRVNAFMSRLWERVEAADAAQMCHWQQKPQKPTKRSKRHREQVAPTWIASAAVPTERKKMFLPRRAMEIGRWSTLAHVNPRGQPAI